VCGAWVKPRHCLEPSLQGANRRQLDAVSVADSLVQDRIQDGCFTDQIVPMAHGNGAGGERHVATAAILDDLQQVVAQLDGGRLRYPVVKDGSVTSPSAQVSLREDHSHGRARDHQTAVRRAATERNDCRGMTRAQARRRTVTSRGLWGQQYAGSAIP